MVKALDIRHAIGWLAPSPMWGAFGDLSDAAQRRRFARPAILRFATDSFMEEFMGTLAVQPEKMAQWQARWETWEEPMANPPAAPIARNEPLSRRAIQLVRAPALLAGKSRPGGLAVSPAPAPQPGRALKLYQPVQNRFYLVSASLVCQQPGLPDRHINAGKQEQAGFVLRRRIPPDTGGSADPLSWDEYAYVHTMSGPRWSRLADKSSVATNLQPSEERLPMFSLGYTDAGSNSRRVFAGLIPVGRREAYIGAPVMETPVSGSETAGGASAQDDSGPDTRVLHFALQVTGPWNELISAAQSQRMKFHGWPPGKSDDEKTASQFQMTAELIAARERIQTNAWYVLLDFVRFLNTYIKPVGEVLAGKRSQTALATPEQKALYAYLELPILNASFKNGPFDLMLDSDQIKKKKYFPAAVATTLASALKKVASNASLQQDLEEAESDFSYDNTPSDWPDFLFPLADPDPTYGPCPLIVAGANLYGGSPLTDTPPAAIDEFFKTLTSKIQAALPDRDQTPQPDIKVPTGMPYPDTEAWFTLRCVYESPNCGPLKPPVLSASTEPFQMASFFDPDAPARQIRIPLPINFSPASLRRYNKSATLMVSDMLCGQLKRIRKLTLGDLVLSVLPWPFHKDLPKPGPAGSCSDNFGMLCSLSIPIVTLCALILLLVIVALFDLFFHWIPLLFLCFPLPKFGAKK
jgi:hypothetical protein